MRVTKKAGKWKKRNALIMSAMLLLGGVTPYMCGVSAKEVVSRSLEEMTEQITTYEQKIKYDMYIEQYDLTQRVGSEYVIDAKDFARVEGMEVELVENYNGMVGTSVLTGDEGLIEWEVDIKESGFYNLALLYCPVEGNGSNMERSLFIDGEIPFDEARIVEFDRMWANELDEIQYDNQGNQLKPRQIEKPQWAESCVVDAQGFYKDPYLFYLEEGVHTLTLVSRREPMMIQSLKLFREDEVPQYEEVAQMYVANGYQKATGETVVIEAENATLKSTPMLYPITDRSSPAVTPYALDKVQVNTIGGEKWKQAGQWVEWEIEVPATGLYQLGFHAKQNWIRGGYVPRKLMIDGEVPFKEMEEIRFEYAANWRQDVLGDDEPYYFYLEEGTHTIRMECVLGELADIAREVEESIAALNTIYRKVIMITGQEVDKWRDYQLEKSIPGIVEMLQVEHDRLSEVVEKLENLTENKNDKKALIQTVVKQLARLIKNVENMPDQLSRFKTNIGALGTWLIQLEEIPLQLDTLYLIPGDAQLPKVKNSFVDKFVHEVKSLYYSFVIDYTAIGNVAENAEERVITVWVGTGRDQANVMKALIDESFTKETGINVNLMLVQMDTLLQATLAGQGPDVAMMVGNDLPMNYGMRGAVVDLTQFPDFEEVTERFYDSAVLPFRYEDRCYALPETQSFNMMFYRKDILNELNIEIPQTWDDVKAIMSVLAKNNMEFGMVPIAAGGGSAPNQTLLMYGMFLYQFGGEFYRDGGRASDLDSDIAINAFKEWVKYYQDYTLTREFDFQSRFRTGEVPIGIVDYSMYNTLQVSAPEIKGLWGFTTVPGVMDADGNIDSTVPSSGSATVIMEKAADKEASWEFMKWWTSADIQTQYGRELEGILGPAGRYPTANKEALAKLPWPVEDFRSLIEQFDQARGIPQVPGGYYTARNVTNAFSTVVIDQKVGPREALQDNVRYINDEIRYKRQEFGLD